MQNNLSQWLGGRDDLLTKKKENTGLMASNRSPQSKSEGEKNSLVRKEDSLPTELRAITQRQKRKEKKKEGRLSLWSHGCHALSPLMLMFPVGYEGDNGGGRKRGSS